MPGEYGTRFYEAEITKARNDWAKQGNGQGYTSRLGELLGRNPAADLRTHGTELEKEFARALTEVEKRSKKGRASATLPEKIAAAPEKRRGGSVASKNHDWFSSVMRRTYAH